MKLLPHAIIVGAIAAFAIWISTVLQIQAWALFLGWVCYFVFGANLKGASWAWLHMIIGMALAAILFIAAGKLGAQLGSLTLPLLVFVLAAGLTFTEATKKLNNIAAYYLGMVMLFASGLAPTPESLVQLAIPLTIGLALGWLTVTLRGRVGAMQSAKGQEA